MLAPDRFVFLHEEGELAATDSWNDPSKDKLWLYNLHYFDELNAVDGAERAHWRRALIQRWITENPPPAGNGWEPYPLSLRIVNWIKWALRGNAMESAWRDSLAVQVRFLRKRLEYHLLGNHLLANAKALVFAGMYFTGEEAEGWLKKGVSVLEREFSEQILADGGHFERSPMYHAIVLGDLLDLVNLGQCFGDEMGVAGGARSYSNSMARWMKNMTHPDGGIGLFNDAAFGVAPESGALLDYAAGLGVEAGSSAVEGVAHLAESGYIRVQRGPLVALLDVAPVGPDYLPGHAHADTLSFELSLFGQRLFVNSGTSTYAKGAERLRQRGTAAHNTVEINGQNSSEVWDSFRVARRARPRNLKIQEQGEACLVRCEHDGYRRLRGRPVHRREWRFAPAELMVSDTIDGALESAVASYHLHPDIAVRFGDQPNVLMLQLPGGQQVRFTCAGGQLQVEDASWHPEFGLSMANQVIRCRFEVAQLRCVLVWVLD